MHCYNFLYTADHTYFPHMLTSIYSLVMNHLEDNIVIHIIESNFSKEDYTLLDNLFVDYSNVQIKLYSVTQIHSFIERYNIPKWRGTDIANARLFAFEIVQDVEKLLYIDSDTIVNNSLINAFKSKMDVPVAAVSEFEIPLHMKKYLDKYYNSGVLLFDYNKWDEFACLDLLYDKMKSNDAKIIYPDQDLLNLALSEIISPLTVDYNVMPIVYDIMKYPFLAKRKFNNSANFYAFEEIDKALEHPRIFHLLGNLYGRPWQKGSINPFNNFYDDYRHMWDLSYEKEENHHLMTKFKIMSYFNVLATTCLPSEACQTLKNKVKEIVYK